MVGVIYCSLFVQRKSVVLMITCLKGITGTLFVEQGLNCCPPKIITDVDCVVGCYCREPWKPSLDDLRQRGGEWAIVADRVEKLVDRSFGARLSVLAELGLSLPK